MFKNFQNHYFRALDTNQKIVTTTRKTYNQEKNNSISVRTASTVAFQPTLVISHPLAQWWILRKQLAFPVLIPIVETAEQMPFTHKDVWLLVLTYLHFHRKRLKGTWFYLTLQVIQVLPRGQLIKHLQTNTFVTAAWNDE